MITRAKQIEATVSPARLHRFVQEAGSAPRALRLYRWNAQVAAAYWTPLHFLEVAVRNAVHSELASYHGTEWWFQDLD